MPESAHGAPACCSDAIIAYDTVYSIYMRYVALIRGVGPGNPNMRGEKLKGAFQALGMKNVHPIISSGNVVFDSTLKDSAALEKKLEQGLEKQLKFSRAVIIRSHDEIKKLVNKNPFKGVKDEKPNYLVVTFFKQPRKELCTVVDMEVTDGPAMMQSLEKSHGKNITTRTWKTVNRILAKMEAIA
jgi:uncharacterized protein (DUF1697 family)